MAVSAEHARLESVRLAGVIAHCLPDLRLELRATCDRSVRVGFDGRCDLTPCALLEAIAEAMRTSPGRLGPLVGLPHGCPRARIESATLDRCHVGLGVYRHDACDRWGYFLATTLDPETLRSTILEQSATFMQQGGEEHRTVAFGHWLIGESGEVGVAACRSEYSRLHAGLGAAAEQLALQIAAATLILELIQQPGTRGADG